MNVDVKIKEIISECRMETHKMRADYERRIKENKLKQWVRFICYLTLSLSLSLSLSLMGN